LTNELTKKPASWKAVAALAALSAPATAQQQTLYQETPDGWTIYREARSCALYTDTEAGTMLRFSDRTDENRLYFMAVNVAWKLLKPREGEMLSIYLEFPHIRRLYGSSAMIVENIDGRMGFTANSFATEDIMLGLASEQGLIVSIMFNNDKSKIELERLETRGGAIAATHLRECSLHHFSGEHG
jgi:hypothetical protein